MDHDGLARFSVRLPRGYSKASCDRPDEGAALKPFEGAYYWTTEGEAKRQSLNDWIRTSKAYDAVLDFDAAVRNTGEPTKLRARFDSGNHLHLNAAGYRALADAIDLALFKYR